MVGSGKLSVDHDKVANIAGWQPPTNVKGVQQFLRFSNYYYCLILHFATIAVPISNLLLVKGPFV